MNIYVFGNELIREDSRALRIAQHIAPQLPAVQFVATDPNEDFPPSGEREVVILDVVAGISKVMVLDFSDLAPVTETPVSPHDYDLLFHLMLLVKMKRLTRVTIIAIPQHEDEQLAKQEEEVAALIATVLSENGKRRTCRDHTRG